MMVWPYKMFLEVLNFFEGRDWFYCQSASPDQWISRTNKLCNEKVWGTFDFLDVYKVNIWNLLFP